MSYKILAFDGGGIRGLITALLLQDLDKCGIVAKADGFAGTSTGGLIALALADGKPIEHIVDIYLHKGGKIFQENWDCPFGEKLQEQAAEGILSGPGYVSSQYTHQGIQEIATSMFHDRTLAKIDENKLVVVNSARLWNGESWTACALSNRSGNEYRDVKLADAALATSAAPSYFPPYRVEPFGYFADGGTFANNPSMTAIGEALADPKVSLQDIRMLSLGTGALHEGVAPQAFAQEGQPPACWGVTTWMWWQETYNGATVPALALMNLVFDCTSKAATSQAQQLLGDHYKRGNVPLKDPIALDDYEKVGELKKITEAYMKTKCWDKVREWVAKHWN